jgi:outer membrane protein assembly factor BamE (lipoprotein component of BamABCDE complex)
MSNIFANVDRMNTGTKLFFVAIGVLIMLAYSLENQPTAQRPVQTSASIPTPAPVAAPLTAPPDHPVAAARATANKPETVRKPVASNSFSKSDEPDAPVTDAVTPPPKPLTISPPPTVIVPETAPTEVASVASEHLTRPTVQPSELPPPGFFTVGSTKDDVLRTQGPPRTMAENRWAYGLSSVEFRNGQVVTWNESPINPLKAVLLPGSRTDALAAHTKGFFTVGSSKDEVLGVQGTPTRFSDTYWTYGLSSVEFNSGEVAGWNESQINPLKARLLPADQGNSSAAKARGYFTVGSTKDEVLGVQGTPSRFSDTHWTYGLSSVEFTASTVASWNDSPINPLRARILPTDQAASAAAKTRGYFTVGSTKDEVLGVQGTPSRFSDTHWAYGLSSVSFQSGVVTTWNSSPINPLRASLIPDKQEDAAAARAKGFFTVGSTKDEVLGVQGTPASFSDTHWSYGLSSVSFQGGRVTTWNSSPLNPLRARKLP